MARLSRQAGETANRYQLKVEDLKDEAVFANGDVLVDAKWKAARFRGLQNINEHDAEDLVQDWLCKVWQKRGDYDPTKGASRRTYAKGLIEGDSLNDNRRIEAQRDREKLTLDKKVEGGKPGSREMTNADRINEDSDLMPPNFRGARRIRTTCDLDLIHDMMGDGPDWRIFILRWLYPVTNEALAEELGWTISKLRNHLKGYERRWSRILRVHRTR